MNGQRTAVCSGCGRHRSRAFLQTIAGKVGMYCPPCRKPYEMSLDGTTVQRKEETITLGELQRERKERVRKIKEAADGQD